VVVASRWTKIRDHGGEAVGWLEINTDTTARKRAEDAARRLSGRILTLQDEERRRIARELHDSLGQYLTAAKINLDRLSAADNGNAALASQCSEIVAKCLMETRTISHLLHPPLLDEAGLASAARWYADGFAERSGIKVNLSLPPELGRLHRDVEIALFRVLQEGLTNVHRHSGGSAVNIGLTVATDQVHLEIKDNGQGIPPGVLKRLAEGAADTGVGLAGMRERVHELGGSLHIKSNKNGTRLTVTIPISETVQKSVVGSSSTKRVSAA
jgi:signal transduction histidine kinase